MLRKNLKNIISAFVVAAVWMLLVLYCWLKPADDISYSERRKLAQPPELNYQTAISGEFMDDFETYAQDQFPERDSFRRLKAVTRFYIFDQKDNNDIYMQDGYAAKLEYPLNESSIIYAAEKFQHLYEKYMKEKKLKVYLSVVPDKGYFLAKDNGYPSMDYDRLFELMKNNTEFARYIDITDTLKVTDYYKTDIHWRQEKIVDVAEKIGAAMGISDKLSGNYTKIDSGVPFYGVYYGQSALPLDYEKLYYLVNDTIENCTVYNYETDNTTSVYDTERLHGKDAYDVFLSGAAPLLVIENPNADTDKELIVFRDSFGSSLVPLLTEGYSKITLVDIRYVASDMLENFITFDKQDVLFLYSTLTLNSSAMLK